MISTLKGFLVSLNSSHSVNEFNNIDGIVYDVDSFEEVENKLKDYIEFMESEKNICHERISYQVINFASGEVKNYEI